MTVCIPCFHYTQPDIYNLSQNSVLFKGPSQYEEKSRDSGEREGEGARRHLFDSLFHDYQPQRTALACKWSMLNTRDGSASKQDPGLQPCKLQTLHQMKIARRSLINVDHLGITFKARAISGPNVLRMQAYIAGSPSLFISL
jgi:hypothetical protein